MRIDLEEGSSYTSDDKVFEVLKKHGKRYVLLPKSIHTGVELPPIVLGDNDINFFKKLKEFDASGFEDHIKSARIEGLEKMIRTKAQDLSQLQTRIMNQQSSETVLRDELDQLEEVLKDLVTPQSVKFIKEELE
jgi:hypothetical protein